MRKLKNYKNREKRLAMTKSSVNSKGNKTEQDSIKKLDCSNTTKFSKKRSKSELLNIYSKAKKGKYDLRNLELREIQLLNKLLKEEIKIKIRKLEEIENN